MGIYRRIVIKKGKGDVTLMYINGKMSLKKWKIRDVRQKWKKTEREGMQRGARYYEKVRDCAVQ